MAKAYPGGVQALHPLDLRVEAGEVFGVIGRSGAGKSTLIRLVNGLETPSAGAVSVDGEAVAALPPAELRALRRRIGMIFQHFNLLSSKTVRDNVAMPLRLSGVARGEAVRRAEALLQRVGLAGLGEVYPARLSGGQKQRVGIARALATEPKILLCDEATSALDPETTEEILALIARLNRELGLTVVLITHEMDVVRRVCDRVAVLEAGRLVESGSAADVFLHPRTGAARRLVRESEGGDALDDANAQDVVRLTFRGEVAYAPLLSQAARETGVDVSILSGRISRIKDAPYGQLVVRFAGGDRAAALARLAQAGVEVEGAR